MISPYISPGIQIKITDFMRVEWIKEAVCHVFLIEWDTLKERKRDWQSRTWPRQVAHFMLKKYTRYSLAKIGLMVGGKDHATVLHSINVIKTEIERHVLFHNDYELYLKLIEVEKLYLQKVAGYQINVEPSKNLT